MEDNRNMEDDTIRDVKTIIQDNKERMRRELERRINQANLQHRIKVIIDDKLRDHMFGPAYPNSDISELVNWIISVESEIAEEYKEDPKGQYRKAFKFPRMKAEPYYADVYFIREKYGYHNDTIIEFKSEMEQTNE